MTTQAKSKRTSSPWDRDKAAEREEKREAVLHAAARAFGEKGYYRTSLDDIAERLGVTKPTLYYYARNKEDLIFAVGDRALTQIIAAIDGDPRASGLEQLKHLLRRYAEVITTDFGKCLVELADTDLSDQAGKDLRANKKKIADRIRALITAGVEDGSIASCDTQLTSFMLAGAINGIGRWYREDGPLTPAALAEIYVNQLAAGLIPRS